MLNTHSRVVTGDANGKSIVQAMTDVCPAL